MELGTADSQLTNKPSPRQQTLTTANLTVSQGPVINIVSEATQHQSSPVDQHQCSQVVPKSTTNRQHTTAPINISAESSDACE
jgi:hypothetical protein